MSSKYPTIDDRPIDQFKVVELKEELKKRQLPTRGLKDDLIKRLAEALRTERENSPDDSDSNSEPFSEEKETGSESDKVDMLDDPKLQVGYSGPTQEGDLTDGTLSARGEVLEEENTEVVTKTVVPDVELTTEDILTSEVEEKSSAMVVETVTSEVEFNEEGILSSKVEERSEVVVETLESIVNGNISAQLENEDLKPQMGTEDPEPHVGIEDLKPHMNMADVKPQLDKEDQKPRLDNEDEKPQLVIDGSHILQEDLMDQSFAPNYQVSESSPILGSQVKSDSISTDSVSINEKNELKDNIIDDNVKLELDVIKTDLMEPSSNNLDALAGELHPMDVEELPREKLSSVEGKDYTSTAVNADLIIKNDSVDVRDSEKLNLDRSSGDESMEDDTLETKQVDSKYNDEVVDKKEKSSMSGMKEESTVDIVGDDFSGDNKHFVLEHGDHSVIPPEKRKLTEEETGGISEPPKRQRRWKSESIKVPEPHSSKLTSPTSKEIFQSPGTKANFLRSDSSVSEDAPKERVVPPTQKPITNSLRIDRFLRPFMLKAVQELLGKTGTVTDFWMDHIKTHCYVTYSSVEEAVETRNALYNLQWPSNGGRLLVADFVEPLEVKNRVEAPKSLPPTPTPSAPITTQQPQTSSRQQLPLPPILPPPTPPPKLSTLPPIREQLNAPKALEKVDPPIVTLDDLFRKTKATPRIYYLPLSDEAVAAKRNKVVVKQ